MFSIIHSCCVCAVICLKYTFIVYRFIKIQQQFRQAFVKLGPVKVNFFYGCHIQKNIYRQTDYTSLTDKLRRAIDSLAVFFCFLKFNHMYLL